MRLNRTLMERVRAELIDAGAEKETRDAALASVVHALNRFPPAEFDVKPLEALTGRRPNVARFRVWGRRGWALYPKKQQRKLEPKTDVGRFVGYTVGGKVYRILEDGMNKFLDLRDVLIEEKPAKAGTWASGSRAGIQLTMSADRDNSGGMGGSIGMLDAEGDVWEKHSPVGGSESEDDGDPDGLLVENGKEENQSHNDSTLLVGQVRDQASGAAVRHQAQRGARADGCCAVDGRPVPLRVTPPGSRTRHHPCVIRRVDCGGRELFWRGGHQEWLLGKVRRARDGRGQRLFGMKVMHDRGAKQLTLSSPGHIMALLQEFGIDTCAPKKTAMASGVKLRRTGENVPPDGNRRA